MAKLIQTLQGTALREYPLSEGKVRIGRSPDTEIQLDDDAVSGYHAELVVAAERLPRDTVATSCGSGLARGAPRGDTPVLRPERRRSPTLPPRRATAYSGNLTCINRIAPVHRCASRSTKRMPTRWSLAATAGRASLVGRAS